MSLQVCHCGWSKTTNYQGLRVHQGKMGCTPKGMRIPEPEQFSYLPTVTILSPQIKLTDPFMDIFKNSVKSGECADCTAAPSYTLCSCRGRG